MSEEWRYQGPIVTIASPWMTIFGEHWLDQAGQALDYWRVERAHSVIVLPIHDGHFLLPQTQFRPGVQRPTLDFPGGRLPDEMTPVEAAPPILKRELGLAPDAIASLTPLNEQGWIINSSFSNQLLYGVVAHLHSAAAPDPALLLHSVPCDAEGAAHLLRTLECLQCRAVLHAFLSSPSGEA